MTTLTLNVSKTELENRIQKALENTMGSPIVKKRNKIINAAMVQILHGGNSEGQNEHNLDQFFKESTRENIIDGLIQKNYLKKENGKVFLGSKKIDHENIKYISYEISQDIKDVKYPVLNEKETIEDTVDNFLKNTYKKIMEHCAIHFINFEDVSDYFDICGVYNVVKDFIKKENGDLESINWSTFDATNFELVEKIQSEKLIIQKTFVDFLIKEKYINFKYSFEDIENVVDIPDEIQDEFFPKIKKQWIATENYSVGKSYDIEEATIFTANTKDEATRKVLSSAIAFIADYDCFDFNINELNNFMKDMGFELTEEDFLLEKEDGTATFLSMTSNYSIEKQESVLMYLETLDDVEGHFSVQEVELEDKPKNNKVEKREVTICNTIISHFDFNEDGSGTTLESVDVYNDLDIDEHNKRLNKLFFQFCPDNDSIVEELLEKSIIEDKIEEEEHEFKNENDLCEILEWVQDNIEANELIDLIEDLTMGLTKIEVSYESKII